MLLRESMSQHLLSSPEVLAACCQDDFVCMEGLPVDLEGDITVLIVEVQQTDVIGQVAGMVNNSPRVWQPQVDVGHFLSPLKK